MTDLESDPVKAGVIGVGSMGQNHARVYGELPEAELVGVFDVESDRAVAVADEQGTEALSMDGLLDAADAVSIAVPTPYHYDMARECIEAGVSVLVEKPFVEDPDRGRELVALADEHDVALQVGHIERFNPAVQALRGLVDDLDVCAITADRLGPPLDRDIPDSAVMDIMIHDVDIVLDLVDGEPTTVDAVGTEGGEYASANLHFDSGVAATLTASRVTQEKVRGLTISAADCRVKVDYMDQTLEIHRASVPSYIYEDSPIRHRHESVVEELTVDRGEPLQNELSSFAEAAATGAEPVVTGEDGLRALELTRAIDEAAAETYRDDEAEVELSPRR